MDRLHISLRSGTLLAAEVTAVMPYAVNDLWVFSEQRPAWILLLWQFHVANAEGFAIWWAVTAISARAAIYNIASGLGTAEYLLLGMATNFIWIWHKCAPAATVPTGPTGREVTHGD